MSPTCMRLVGVLLLLVAGPMQAATLNWVGGSGSWHEASHWDLGRTPQDGDDVVIDTGIAVTVIYDSGTTLLNSLVVNGSLDLAGGSLTVQADSQISGGLRLQNGATLSAEAALLSVEGFAIIAQANLIALNGAQIILPVDTQYLGPGLLRAQGPGSRLELATLERIGLPAPGSVLITDAVSREVGVFNGAPLLDISDAVSREVSVFNNTQSEQITDAVSREIGVTNTAP